MAELVMTQAIFDSLTENAKVYINDVEITAPTDIERNDTLRIELEDGYVFAENQPRYRLRISQYQNLWKTFGDKLGNNESSINEENNVAEITFVWPYGQHLAANITGPYTNLESGTVPVAEPEPEPDYIVTQQSVDNMANNNVELRVNDVPIYAGMEIFEGDTLVATTVGNYSIVYVRYFWQDPITGVPTYKNFTVVSPNEAVSEWGSDWEDIGVFLAETEQAEPEPDPEPEPSHIVTQQSVDNMANNNVELRVNDVPIYAGMEIFEGDTLVATTVGNYSFVYIRYAGLDTVYGGVHYQDFTQISPNEAVSEWGSNWKETGWFEASVEPYTPEITGTNRVYLVDNDIVASVNAARFQQVGNDVIDYGDYILGLIELPFKLPVEYLGGTGNIQLGNYDSGVEATSVTVDKLPVDMGTITIPEIENNLLDYSGVVCNLHLPYTQSIVLDPIYVIGQTIGIEYLIDLYTGEATINISSTKVGEVFFTKQTSLGINIPYMRTGSSANLDNASITVGGDNRIETPFIEIVKYEAVLPNGFFTVPIVDEALIGAQSGYVQVEQIELQTKANSGEAQQIRAILANGVIVK